MRAVVTGVAALFVAILFSWHVPAAAQSAWGWMR